MSHNGWKSYAVREMGAVQAGRQRSPSFDKGTLRPYLRVANVFDGRIDSSDVNLMPFTDEEFSRYKLESGEILLNEGQSLELVGRPAMYEGIPENCCFQNTLIRFRPSSNVEPSFALKRFQQCLYDGTFQGIAKKTTSIAHLGVSRFADLVLSWPPMEEQKEIVNILRAWDQAIAVTERILANSEQRKVALMQRLLGSKDEAQGYKTLRLGQLFSERNETGYVDLPLLSVTRDDGIILRSDVGRKDTSNEDKAKYLRVCVGDIAYNTMRMWQGVSALSALEGIVSPAYTVLKPSDLIDGPFAACLFKYPPVISLFYRHSQGLVSDTWNLKFQHFSKIEVAIPPLAEQMRISQILADVDTQIGLERKALAILQSEKKTLMDHLLTGKRRVRLTESALNSPAA